MAAFSLMMVILITGIVYDFGLWFATKVELQNVADAAALAGGRALGARHAGGRFYDGTEFQDPERKSFSVQLAVLSTEETDWIKDAINDSGEENLAGGISISIPPSDIQIGNWNSDTNGFSLVDLPKNAVQVTAKRDDLVARFGQLIGVSPYDLTATATAALTPLQWVPPADLNPTASDTLPPGPIILPLGIDQANFEDPLETNFCTAQFQLPTDDFNQPCHAWTTFKNEATDIEFQKIVDEILTAPDTKARSIGIAGDSYFFGGFGADKKTELKAIFTANLPPGATSWETILPVYANFGCVAPTNEPGDPGDPIGEQIPIVAFISASIRKITTNPQEPLEISFQCDVVGIGRSGEVNDPNLAYGTVGSVPVLVQ